MNMTSASKLVSIAALMALPLAHANEDHGRREGLGEHPAVLAARHAAEGTIDPNRFILGHPAGGAASAGAVASAAHAAGSARQHVRTPGTVAQR